MEIRKTTIDMLRKLKFNEKKHNPLATEKNLFGFKENTVRKDNLQKECSRYEKLLREVESIESKVKSGNYLNYYQQMNEVQKKFLEETDKIDTDIEIVSPVLFKRILFKREQLKNKKI